MNWKEKLSKRGREITFVKCDLTDINATLKMCKNIRNTYSIKYLVLNMGIGTYASFEEYDYNLWNKVMNTNLTIPAFMIQSFLDNFADSASILLISSYAGDQPYSSSIVYGVSKAGVSFMARNLVKVLERYNVRINAIEPGFIETNWHKTRTNESREIINRKIAVHRFGYTEEIASIAIAVLENEYMNGSIIPVHGGYDYF